MTVPIMLCNNCCLQSTLCLWLWLVLTFGYVLLYNCPHSRHNVLLLLNILYHHYWASLPHLQTECAIVLQSTGHTHVYAYTYAHTHHTHIHSHVITYLTIHSLQCWCLLILVPFLQDGSGWPLVERSLTNNKQLEYLALDGCDDFLLNMGKALTKNTSIKTLNLASESL